MADEKARKVKHHDKFHTRAKSLRLLTAGADPNETFVNDKGEKKNRFTGHPNSHVRVAAAKVLAKLNAAKVELPPDNGLSAVND